MNNQQQEQKINKVVRDTTLLYVSEVLKEFGFGFHYEGSTHRVHKGSKELPAELMVKLLVEGVELSCDTYDRTTPSGEVYTMYIYYLKSY